MDFSCTATTILLLYIYWKNDSVLESHQAAMIIYVLSNLSEHGSHKSVIRNILAVLNFPSNKLYQAKADPIKAAINIIPSQMTFFISDDSFERVKGFQGWIIVEVIGERKKNIE